MGTSDGALAVARSKIGVTEWPPGSNLNEFGAWYGMNGVPWCAEFVSFCTFASGTPLAITTDHGFAYCPYGINWFRQQGRWSGNAQHGALVFFDWDGDGLSDHVGIVDYADGAGVHTIEGNTGSVSQNNGGAVMARVRASNISGYGMPPYSGAPAPGPVVPPSGPSLAPPFPGRILALTSPNMHGNDVAVWQAKMIERGWNQIGAADGYYGPKSAVVCVVFQKEKGLPQDAKVGPITWAATWNSPVTP